MALPLAEGKFREEFLSGETMKSAGTDPADDRKTGSYQQIFREGIRANVHPLLSPLWWVMSIPRQEDP